MLGQSSESMFNRRKTPPKSQTPQHTPTHIAGPAPTRIGGLDFLLATYVQLDRKPMYFREDGKILLGYEADGFIYVRQYSSRDSESIQRFIELNEEEQRKELEAFLGSTESQLLLRLRPTVYH